ncbi:MAG TPA: histidinol dehydrogenase [Rectinemataceae bacterium]
MDRHPLRRLAPGELPIPSLRLIDPEVDALVARVLTEVRKEGEAALRRWAENLGEIRPGNTLSISRQELKEAWDSLDSDARGLLERSRDRVAAFARAQRRSLSDVDIAVSGGRAGHRFVPVRTAGCYVPGGRFPLPSSALMTIVPAKEAGVQTVWCAGPKPSRVSLGAAWLAGADGFTLCGGAQGVAALAFGVCGPRCDVVVGPGGRYAASAKRQLSGLVGMEAPAGPSELLVIADGTADPRLVALDLLAVAEHDPDALAMLICRNEDFALAVETQLAMVLDSLPTENKAAAEASLAKSWIRVEPDEGSARALAEAAAPEHLSLQVEDPEAWASAIGSAGAIFMGGGSAEVFGDYCAGPNHTLPTGGAARFAAGLSVLTFLRPRTWLMLEDPGALSQDAQAFARMEGLEAHALAAGARSGRGRGLGQGSEPSQGQYP